MEMIQAWEDVERLLQDVRPHLLRAGIPDRQLKMPDAEPTDIRIERYLEIFDWVSALIASDEWAALLKAWRLRPEHIWEQYRIHELKGLQEQLLLEKAQAGIRKRWKLARPFFFGRTFKKGKNDGSDSDETATDSTPEAESPAEQNRNRQGAARERVRSEGGRAAARDRRNRERRVLRQPGDGVSGGRTQRASGLAGRVHPKRNQSPGSGNS